MQGRGSAGWEDLVDPCGAMGCLWHENKETRSCGDEEEKIRLDGERRLRVFRLHRSQRPGVIRRLSSTESNSL